MFRKIFNKLFNKKDELPRIYNNPYNKERSSTSSRNVLELNKPSKSSSTIDTIPMMSSFDYSSTFIDSSSCDCGCDCGSSCDCGGGCD